MSTHDYVIDNALGANFRADINTALAAIVSNNSSAAEPSTPYAYMFWADTTSDTLKQRNAANNGWVSLLTLSTGAPVSGVDTNTYVSSGAVAGNNLTLTLSDLSTVVIDVTALVGGGGSALTLTKVQTGELAAFDVWLADVSSTIQTRNLPVAPIEGDEVVISDDKGNSFTNNITIGRNGKLIMGLAEDLVIGIDSARVHLKYDAAGGDWRIIG